jgi:uncharacterized protein (DUF427 family)
MPRATWHGTVLAESDETVVLEGNHYFPPETVRREFLRESPTQTVCPWKGQASYFTVEVDGRSITDAAWFYPDPLPDAKDVAGYVACWKGVKVEA